jgi:hypothetical protein
MVSGLPWPPWAGGFFIVGLVQDISKLEMTIAIELAY